MHAQNFEDLLDELQQARHGDEVSIEAMVEAIGQRAFGPLLALIGLLIASPLGGVPGAATLGGVASLIASSQLLVGRRKFWLPRWLLRRRWRYERFRRGLDLMRRPARRVDRLLRPRLGGLLQPPYVQFVALVCVIIGLVLPLLEAVPFADTIPALALVAFGLGLVARDGLCVLIAAALCFGAAGLAAYALMN